MSLILPRTARNSFCEFCCNEFDWFLFSRSNDHFAGSPMEDHEIANYVARFYWRLFAAVTDDDWSNWTLSDQRAFVYENWILLKNKKTTTSILSRISANGNELLSFSAEEESSFLWQNELIVCVVFSIVSSSFSINSPPRAQIEEVVCLPLAGISLLSAHHHRTSAEIDMRELPRAPKNSWRRKIIYLC